MRASEDRDSLPRRRSDEPEACGETDDLSTEAAEQADHDGQHDHGDAGVGPRRRAPGQLLLLQLLVGLVGGSPAGMSAREGSAPGVSPCW